jgi:hypothetical protein
MNLATVFRQNKNRILTYQDGKSTMIENAIRIQNYIMYHKDNIKRNRDQRIRYMKRINYLIRLKHINNALEELSNLEKQIHELKSQLQNDIQKMDMLLKQLNTHMNIFDLI